MKDTTRQLLQELRAGYIKPTPPTLGSSYEHAAAGRRDFATDIADLCNAEEVRQLLGRKELSLFSHCNSSMGAIMCGNPPDYEIVMTSEQLLVRRYGKITESYTLPALIPVWEKVLPFGEFHDSSCGDYSFPDENYMESLQQKIRSLR